ncbi:MAG TPA: YHS domain-containing protein, partial [Candidatus Dormibacteraeota bacterium]
MVTPAPMSATDPVCQMPVDPSGSGPLLEFQGERFWFCSPSCRDRFQAQPERYRDGLAKGAETATDPVCGMTVATGSAAAALTHADRPFYFCSTTCRDRFAQHPDRYSSLQSLKITRTVPDLPIDPVCGMSVDPADPGARLELPEGTVYFCCQPCADEYAARQA